MPALLNYIVWDVSPFIYEGEHFAIGWYGTLIIIGLLLILFILHQSYKRDNRPSSWSMLTFIAFVAGVFFFAHLFQGLFYEWYYSPDNPWYFLGREWNYKNYYFDHPWKFLDIAHGGFASHGLYFYVLLLSMLLSTFFKVGKWYVSDRLYVGVFFLGVFVRLGNFINAEIYGIPTDMPWGVLFPDEEFPAHPTQIYESLIFLSAGIIGECLLLSKAKESDGLITGVLLVYTSILRLLIEFIKLPNMPIEQEWVLNMGQILSIPFLLFGCYLIYKSQCSKVIKIS